MSEEDKYEWVDEVLAFIEDIDVDVPHKSKTIGIFHNNREHSLADHHSVLHEAIKKRELSEDLIQGKFKLGNGYMQDRLHLRGEVHVMFFNYNQDINKIEGFCFDYCYMDGEVPWEWFNLASIRSVVNNGIVRISKDYNYIIR